MAKSVSDGVNVRSGANKNFERLCQLDKGEEVIVQRQQYSWYQIQLPERAFVFISDKYLQETGPLKGRITTNKVNVRASANIDSTILGQLDAGDEVDIVEKITDWYKIRPGKNIFGWVSANLLKWESKDVSQYHPQTSLPKSEIAEAPAPIPVQKKSQAEKVTLKGTLGVNDADPSSRNHYVLTKDGKTAYLLRGLDNRVDAFLGRPVIIEGELIVDPDPKGTVPVVVPSKVQLVL